MFAELPPFVANALVGLLALVLLVMFWRSTRGSRAVDTAIMRIGLVLLLMPFVIAAVIGSMHKQPGSETASAPAARPQETAEVPAGAGARTPAGRPASGPASGPASAPVSTTTPAPVAEAAKPAAPQSTPVKPEPPPLPRIAPAPETGQAPGSTRPRQEIVIPPPPVQSETRQARPQTQPQLESVTPPAEQPASARPTEAWDVVPVYYGTDRNAETTGSRLTYGSERARRLEFGRALVTVPKSHEVPNVERPWVYRLPFTRIVIFQEQEDPAKHFTLKEIKAMSPAELAQIVRDRLGASNAFKDQALVFLHGFNNSFEGGLFRTAQIAYDLKFDGAPFMYSWPSKGALGLQDYSYDRESSGQAEPYLRQFLEFVMRETGAKAINIIAHSMGNQVLLNVLRDLKRGAPADVKIGQVILAAPDVDRDTFEFIAKEIAGVAQGITVLAASNDRALEASRRFWGGVPRAGDVPPGGPVVIAGIDTIDITALSTEVLSLNHNGYAQKHQLIDDMRLLLKDGTRPPEKRTPGLELVPTEKGTFWRYR